jgi:hypothetical protein
LYIIPITDEAKGWEEEAPLVPLPLPANVILKVIGIGDEGELEESNKVLLRALSWVDRTIFILPISEIRVDSRDNPLLFQEMQGFEDMKIKPRI